MLVDQIGVVHDGREVVLIVGDVIEVERLADLARLSGTCPAPRETLTDLDGQVVPCSVCGRMWRVPRGMERTTRCGRCSAATEYRLRVIAAS